MLTRESFSREPPTVLPYDSPLRRSYQIKLDGDSDFIFAPVDCDCVIRSMRYRDWSPDDPGKRVLAAVQNRRPPPPTTRFAIGAQVQCNMDGDWFSGTVVAHNYREAAWPDGQVAP